MSAPAPEPPPFVVLDDAVVEARRTLPPDVLAKVRALPQVQQAKPLRF